MRPSTGITVDQYHEEKSGHRSVINLGRFDRAKHIEWVDKNPSKKPKPVQNRKHVSHFYSGGDVCDVTGEDSPSSLFPSFSLFLFHSL